MTMTSCLAGDVACVRSRRINVSAAFFIEQDFSRPEVLSIGFTNHRWAANPATLSSPRIARTLLVISSQQAIVADAWVQRAEFPERYPADLDGIQFIDALLQTVQRRSGVDLSLERPALIADWNLMGAARGSCAWLQIHRPLHKRNTTRHLC